MKPLPMNSSDEALIEFIDGWAGLLEREDYESAFAYTDHVADMGWTPTLIREVIKSYDAARPDQKVTVDGVPSDVTQQKRVTWWPKARPGGVGEIWYDLNIDGMASDLTATFYIIRDRSGLTVRLNDIHVM